MHPIEKLKHRKPGFFQMGFQCGCVWAVLAIAVVGYITRFCRKSYGRVVQINAHFTKPARTASISQSATRSDVSPHASALPWIFTACVQED